MYSNSSTTFIVNNSELEIEIGALSDYLIY